jgi:hypothetical protein
MTQTVGFERMAHITPGEAIERARGHFNLDAGVNAEALPVRRLDGGPAYYLVLFGDPESTIAVATVSELTGEVRESVRFPGGRAHLPVRADVAVRLSGVRDVRSVELVWRPSRVTRSPLYPAWEVRGDRVAYVDQHAHTWAGLS